MDGKMRRRFQVVVRKGGRAAARGIRCACCAGMGIYMTVQLEPGWPSWRLRVSGVKGRVWAEEIVLWLTASGASF